MYYLGRVEHTPARADHALAHAVLVADRVVEVEGWEASSDDGVAMARVGLSQPEESRLTF